jgi:hypothetical protein
VIKTKALFVAAWLHPLLIAGSLYSPRLDCKIFDDHRPIITESTEVEIHE